MQDSASFKVLGMESEGDRWKDVQLITNRFSMLPEPQLHLLSSGLCRDRKMFVAP